jgi:signal transduction histidine kinase
LNPAIPVPNHSLPEAAPLRRGLDSGVEKLIREWLQLAGALTGTTLALILRDESGIWHREGIGLEPAQWELLDHALAAGGSGDDRIAPPGMPELRVLQVCPLVDGNQRNLGVLGVLSSQEGSGAPDRQEGFQRVAAQLQGLICTGRSQIEGRGAPRAPSATSFVPGLVHELGSFIFGISANLDAFEARFADMEDVGKYAAPIRRSLDRISAFLEELREFGDPQRYAWAEVRLENLLRAGVEALKPLARAGGVDLRLEFEGALPLVSADEPSLRAAFEHVLDFLVRQEEPGRTIVVQAGSCLQDARPCVGGRLEASGLKVKNVDLARLFEPFYFRTSGLGRLALPVARRVFESHGGSLAAGPGPDGGIRIQFSLPALPVLSLRAANRP